VKGSAALPGMHGSKRCKGAASPGWPAGPALPPIPLGLPLRVS